MGCSYYGDWYDNARIVATDRGRRVVQTSMTECLEGSQVHRRTQARGPAELQLVAIIDGPRFTAGGNTAVAASGSSPVTGLGYFHLGMFGAQVEGSEGVSAVRVNAYARLATEDRPFGVVNDYVASSLGLAAGLPVPPGTLLHLHGGQYGYLSLGFSEKGDRLPPVLFDEFAALRAWEASGIIAFDQWVANGDRHDENLAFHPKLGVAVFDHDLSLLGRAQGDVAQVLRETRDNEIKSHSIPPFLMAADYLSSWCERIGSIRFEEIRRIVFNCVHAKLLDKSVADELIRFIEHRKSRVRDYLTRTRHEYELISEWPLDLGEVNNVV